MIFSKHGLYNRENFYVTVVVDGSFAVSLQMERVDHVDIVQICSGSFVGKVYRMFQRKVPDREGLVFCITGMDTAFVLMVELGKAGCHLSASRSRCGNDNERTGCLDVLVLSVSLIAHDQRHIMRVARNRVVNVNRDAELLQSLF